MEIDLWVEFKYCCEQWSHVLEDSQQGVQPFERMLSLVSIKTFDRVKKHLLIVYNPKHAATIRLFSCNQELVGFIQKYFGKVTVEFKENNSIVAHSDDRLFKQESIINENR